jgi:hypothetical protein
MFGRLFTIRMLIRAAFTALSLATIGSAHAQPIGWDGGASAFVQQQ